MKTSFLLAATISLIAAASNISQAAGNGTDILHFMVRSPVLNTATNPAIVGSVDVSQNRQGNADNQRFKFQLNGLLPGASYTLWVSYLDDTNLVEAAHFTASASGSASLDFMNVGSSKGKGKGKGHQALPLPLDPLARLREFVVTDVATQAVARASLNDPDSVTYLVSRKLQPSGLDADASGSLRIKANTKGGDLRVEAGALAPNETSILWINGSKMLTATNSNGGSVAFSLKPLSVEQILDIHSLAISDVQTNLLLTTILP